MKFKTLITILLTCTATGFAQNPMADALHKGILEEDSKQDTRAAIQQYESVMTQFAEARQTAATALFRMAECFRKQGNRNAAIASYQRVMKDFGDQTKLAAQSRAVLASTYNTAPTPMPEAKQSDQARFDNLMKVQNQQQAKTDEARARYRKTIEDEIAFNEGQLALTVDKTTPGTARDSAVAAYQEKLIHLKRDLAAFDAGMK